VERHTHRQRPHSQSATSWCTWTGRVEAAVAADAGKSLPAAAAMRTASFFVPVHFIHPSTVAPPPPPLLNYAAAVRGEG